MKYAYLNPVIVAVDEVPIDIFNTLKSMTILAHRRSDLNDEGNTEISIRGGQQIQLLPNQFNLDTSLLKDFVERQCVEYIERTMTINNRTEVLNVKPMLVSAWTIKQGPGDYQSLHSHEAHISGTIYIDIPEFAEDSKISDGYLEFRLPTIKTPGRFILSDTWRVKPEAAKMVVFPSYLAHIVYPWRGTGNRTSLAWDVKLVDK